LLKQLSSKWNRAVLAILLLIVCAAPSFLPSPAYAIANPDSITLHTAKVFQNIFESGDMLFVSRYDVDYAAEPGEDAEDAFQYCIYDTDGSTLLISRPLNYYQHNLISIYQTAAQVTTASLTWESEYVPKIVGNPALFGTLTEDTNVDSMTLAESDWLGGTQAVSREYLHLHCLDIAEILEVDWAIDLIVTTSSGEVLNSAGRTAFIDAIPLLDSAIPGLFQFSSSIVQIDWEDATGTYEEELTVENKAGVAVASAFSGIATYFGVSSNTVAGIFILMVIAIAASIVFVASGNSIAAIVLTTPLVLMGTWMGLIPVALTLIVAMLLVTYAAYYLFLRGI
jgi:hypothetical protein